MKIKLCIFFIIGIIYNNCIGQRIIIKNANIIPINQNVVLKNKSIVIEGGVIKEIGEFKKIAKAKTDKIIDAKNNFVMPSLADMHVHFYKPSDLDTLFLYNVLAGVTHIRVMNSEEDQSILKNNIRTEMKPLIHNSYIFTSGNTVDQLDSIFLVIKQERLDFIKLFSVKDEPTFDALMSRANIENITVCGHYPSKVNLRKVLQSGFKSLEHMPAYIADSNYPMVDELVMSTKQNEVYNCPTFDYFVSALYFPYPDYSKRYSYKYAPQSLKNKWQKELKEFIDKNGIDYINDIRENYKPKFEKQKEVFKKLYKNDCLLLVGSDPSGVYQMNGFALYDEMKIWSDLGLDNFTILKSATLNPAKFFKQENNWGTIEENKLGELIILDKNPLENIDNISSIKYVISQDKIYEPTKILKTLK
jgi:hypothetical protein